jgi:hypothetical protein
MHIAKREGKGDNDNKLVKKRKLEREQSAKEDEYLFGPEIKSHIMRTSWDGHAPPLFHARCVRILEPRSKAKSNKQCPRLFNYL